MPKAVNMARILRDSAKLQKRIKKIEREAAEAREREVAESLRKLRREAIEKRVAYRPDDNHLLRELGDV